MGRSRNEKKRKEKAALLGRDKKTRSIINESDFNGLVYCETCGSPYKRYRIKGKIKWLCGRNYNGWVEHCDSPVFAEEQLEVAFMSRFYHLEEKGLYEKPKEAPIIIEEKFQDPLKQAECVYSLCKVEDFEYQTKKLFEHLKEKPTSFDGAYMKKMIKRITISEEGISFELINHKIVREEKCVWQEK